MAKASRKKQKQAATSTKKASTAPTDSSTQTQASANIQADTTTKKAKKATKKGRRVQKKTNYVPWIIGAVVLVGVLAFPAIQRQYKMRTATGEFAQLVREGNGEMRKLQTQHRDLGRTHVAFGSDITYNSSPATTGPHYGSWINPGYYVDAQEERQLVHSLEHGHIVAYYGENVEDATKDKLIEWTGDFRNSWGGFVATPYEDIVDSSIILTAWRHTLILEEFNPAIAAAFIELHRGRGPENPIR